MALLEEMSKYFADAPAEALLGIVVGNPAEAPATCEPLLWVDDVTENPAAGTTEVWEIYNTTADAHPIHVHEIAFEVVDRQAIVFDEATRQVSLAVGSAPRAREAWETGVKDTVISYPGEVTRIRGRFSNPGQFVWHCHIVEHEDNEMMRPFRIGPEQPGQP
ncbi:MAG TPA: multicopper oxidase domain-containing protein [Aromatoleum sp.]|uniref:multicopper oxidase domain-containing protein n=1 Tax=Aromatoleum sp. TaxID=2307007 RepID=UPI002B47C8CB|nr:multicopper oxidase domain-containing protein [Aromatoleum sp.]HJV25984.1 multicopper oxidase domain-containing protein [Aromatoleum sp.]